MSEQSTDLAFELSRAQICEQMAADASLGVDEEGLRDLTDVEHPGDITAVVDEEWPRCTLLIGELT